MASEYPGGPPIVPPLDPGFRPAVLANRAFATAVEGSGDAVPFRIGLQRPDGSLSTYTTSVFAEGSAGSRDNLHFVERLLKFLVWQRGASAVLVGGPASLGSRLADMYAPDGARGFDADFMSRVYETPFVVRSVAADEVPDSNEDAVALGRHVEGNRIGFDLGASDYKVSAVVDGAVVYADEFPWHPRRQSDPAYHYDHISAGLAKAAEHLSRVDAIGGSSAGVWINDRVRAASLFRGLPADVFESQAKDMFVRIRQEWGVPLNVVNDGEVTALAGSMSLEENAVLGIAMGSSEAAGFVTRSGSITGWLNELAFAPIDYAPHAPVDEWSGDRGCGVQYLCQTGVVRLAEAAGLGIDAALAPAEKLVVVQQRMAEGDERIPAIYQTIGVWLGYALAHYAEFYDVDHVLVLGRVMTGAGGDIIVETARDVLAAECPDTMELHVPDERMKRVGQAVAAASLPQLEGVSA